MKKKMVAHATFASLPQQKVLHCFRLVVFHNGIERVNTSPSTSDEPHSHGGMPSPHQSLSQIAVASLGITVAIACVGSLAAVSNTVLLLGSFGSSSVLLFAYPQSPFSRPRNFVGGHLVSSFVGLLFLHVIGPQWWSMALATGTAFAAMMLTRTIHPPAGSNPLIVYLLSANWSFLWLPTLMGAVALQLLALAHHYALRRVECRRPHSDRVEQMTDLYFK
jgi:CBS-domain-containing membrane protein